MREGERPLCLHFISRFWVQSQMLNKKKWNVKQTSCKCPVFKRLPRSLSLVCQVARLTAKVQNNYSSFAKTKKIGFKRELIGIKHWLNDVTQFLTPFSHRHAFYYLGLSAVVTKSMTPPPKTVTLFMNKFLTLEKILCSFSSSEYF